MDRIYSEPYETYAQFNKMRLQSLAKRSGFGVYFHDSDYQWIDDYFQHGDIKISRLDPHGNLYSEMRRFFSEMSGLKDINI